MAFFANASVFKLGSTTISEVTSISAPNLTADTIDVTTHGSTGRYREFIQGLRDGGEITIEGFYHLTAIQQKRYPKRQNPKQQPNLAETQH